MEYVVNQITKKMVETHQEEKEEGCQDILHQGSHDGVHLGSHRK